jgi:homoserine kinase type II
MSVYTSISNNEFSEILKNYSLGDFIRAQGIQAGIENTNYFITTTKGEFVFTLFEKINQQELGFYISLLQDLSIKGIACPQPQADINKQTINQIKAKPFTFVTRLKGKSLTSVNPRQCKAIAVELAKLHTTSITHSKPLKNRRGKVWREKTAKNLINKLNSNDAKLLLNELKAYQDFDDSQLPKGIIHGDLFKDNALFENNQLSGIIDFYDACYDTYLYDIAITVNAWCIDQSCTNKNGKLIDSLVTAFLQGYQSIRILTDAEQEAWPIMLRIAATRFWLSRLEDSLIPNISASQPGTLTHQKKPKEYRKILENHIQPVDNLVDNLSTSRFSGILVKS